MAMVGRQTEQKKGKEAISRMNAKPKKLLALAALTLALAAMPSKAPVFADDSPISTQWKIESVDPKTNIASILCYNINGGNPQKERAYYSKEHS